MAPPAIGARVFHACVLDAAAPAVRRDASPGSGRSTMKKTHIGGLGLAALAAGLAALPAAAQTLEDRVAALEARQAQPAGLTTPTGFTLNFYGYVKGDLIYDNSHDLGIHSGGIAGITAASTEDSASRAHAYQSRIGIRGAQSTDMGELKFNLEGDFLGGGGGTFRLRHAFGELNGLLAGQTWSLFTPVGELPAFIDANGQTGAPAYRVGQVRYTAEFGDTSAALSLEEDNSALKDRVAIAAAVTQKFAQGSVKLAAISRSLEHPVNGVESSWGATISANAKLWQGGLIQASYTQGDGISSLLPAWSATYAPELDANGQAIGAKGYGIALSHAITPQFEIGAGYGVNDYDDHAGAAADGTDKLSAVHLNVKYKPVKPVTLGLEYIRAERRQFDGARFDNDRIQFAAQYSF
ncbi:hypothetical protein E3U25_08595 (plasmid) [Paracoccus versutus]|nr:hypothetical protein E3U25_08595 [Paracoccus versutus]